MFTKLILNKNTRIFNELIDPIKFENIGKGRKGTVLVSVNCENNTVPIIRTTTKYNEAAQRFSSVHYDIIDEIKNEFKNMKGIENIEFNNALTEIYDPSYRKMGFHTDQSLDLAKDSYICLFSCYKNTPVSKDLRKLIIKNKTTNNISEILLENNSAVLFSTSSNHKHLHKIVLDTNGSNNIWMGMTFRMSNTFIKFIDEIPYFNSSNKALQMATPQEKNAFYKHKGNENSNDNYIYPEINYTISISDMLVV